VMLAYSSPKQATVPLVPHRLPHRIGRGTAGFRGGLHVEGGGSVSGERGALPVDAPSRDVDSRLSSPLEHVGGTQLSLRSISCQLRNAINQTVEQ
jgi:hypothetical protein